VEDIFVLGVLKHTSEIEVKEVIMKTLIIILILLFPLSSNAADKWTKTEIGLQVLSTGLQIIDWGTTLDIVDREDEGYYELNPLLGKHPSKGAVNTYFAISVASNILLSHFLSNDGRKWWLSGRIIISGYLINNNYGIGLKVNF